MEVAKYPDSRIQFESFELDVRTHELYRDGSRLKIRGHPVDVLIILVEHPGELVSRETLQKQLWPGDTFVDFEQILNNSVGRLRDVLGDNAESPHFIETLPRLGYRFIAPVNSNGANHTISVPYTAPSDPKAPTVTDSSNSHRISWRWVIWPMAAFMAAALAVFGYLYVRTPLHAPYISHYEQLTLDGRQKIPRGTDGARVYMNLVGARQGVVQVPVSGGNVTDFPIDLPGGTESPALLANVSPDGSNLLMANQFVFGKGYALWIVGNLGHPVRFLIRGGATGWSPDGRTLVFANPHGDFYTIGVDGGEPRLIHREDTPANQLARIRDVSWSPDGSTIRFTRLAGKIFEMSSTGANLHEWLPGWKGGIQKCCGHWTPDGQFYVFMAERTLAKDPSFRPLGEIWAVDERHGRLRPPIADPILLASRPLLWGNPIPSRDGKKIFARGVSLRGELERFNPKSKRLEPFLGGISADMPAFSRAAKSIAYVSFPDGVLWRANRDGSGLVQLTQPPLYPRNPRWSPDGTQILFTDNSQKGVDSIYIVASQGGVPRRLLPDDGEPQSLADWSPDGTKVVYATEPSFSLVPWGDKKVETRIVELSTGKVTTLPNNPRGFYAPLWSPDGRHLAGHSLDGMQLLAFDLKKGEWNTLSSKGRIDFHNWSHDGRYLYFACQIKEKVVVYRVPANGGIEELVIDLPEDFHGSGWYDYWMSLDPDDVPLLLRDAGTDEIYALTLEQK